MEEGEDLRKKEKRQSKTEIHHNATATATLVCDSLKNNLHLAAHVLHRSI